MFQMQCCDTLPGKQGQKNWEIHLMGSGGMLLKLTCKFTLSLTQHAINRIEVLKDYEVLQ